MGRISNEPVLTAQSITALVSALLVMLVALGVIEITDVQQGAIMAFVIAAVNIGMGLLTRPRVRPISKMSGEELQAMQATLALRKQRRETPQ